MTTPPPASLPADPSRPLVPKWATLMVATCNMLNLALPGRVFYENQEPYGAQEYQRKIAWLGLQLRRLNADVVAAQEVWDLPALKDVVAESGLRYPLVAAPGAELGATGTPRVALMTRLDVEAVQSVSEFPPLAVVDVPELGPHVRFERPVLHAVLRTKQGLLLHVLVAHLKSKRPKFLQNAQGELTEDRDDPRIAARATLRSLVMRASEAVALRSYVVDLLHRTRDPVILMGDLNDAPHAVTSQIIAATSAIAYDRQARDTALFHACDVQTEPALRRDVAYSHVHQGWPEVLDQIWVSEEFVSSSHFALGDVRRVEYFNDHLHEGRERIRSDHGFVRALLRLALPPAPL